MTSLSRGRERFAARGGDLSLLLTSTRRAALALAAASVAALATGIPTGLVRTSFYTRMTPVRWWDYPFWLAGATLLGLIAATFLADRSEPRGSAQTLGGGVLSVFAIGCPICNQLVVALLGVSGALSYFAPLQPLLGLASVGLLLLTLKLRLDGLRSCPLPR